MSDTKELENSNEDFEAKLQELAQKIKPFKRYHSIAGTSIYIDDKYKMPHLDFTNEKPNLFNSRDWYVRITTREGIQSAIERVNNEFDRISKSLAPIVEEDKEITNENSRTINAIIDLIRLCGFSARIPAPNPKQLKKLRGQYVNAKWLEGLHELFYFYTSYANKALTTATETRDRYLKKIKEIEEKIIQQEKEKEADVKKQEELIAAISYATENKIEISGLSSKEILDVVSERQRREFIKENYPDGEEFKIGCCDECSSYIMGDRRCSCGNVRVDLVVEKINGEFYGSFERY